MTQVRTQLPPQIKNQVKQKFGFKCVKCGADNDITIDHIIPLADGGTNDLSNLQTLCVHCNRLKSNIPPFWKRLKDFFYGYLYTVKNEIRGELTSRLGIFKKDLGDFRESHQSQITALTNQIADLSAKLSAVNIHTNQLAQRHRALQQYLSIEWTEQEFKGYKKLKKLSQKEIESFVNDWNQKHK
jgi:hypothetical protein